MIQTGAPIRETLAERVLVPDLTAAVDRMEATTQRLAALMEGVAGTLGAIQEMLAVFGHQQAAAAPATSGAAHGPLAPEVLPAPATTAPSPPLPPAVVTLPLSPQTLIRMVEAAGDRTYGYDKMVSFPLTIQPGEEFEFVLYPPPEHVTLLLDRIRATCDTYSSLVQVVEVIANGHQYIDSQGFVIDGPKEIPAGEFLVIGEQGLQVVLFNPSTVVATVFVYALAAHLTAKFNSGFFQKSLRSGYLAMRAAIGGGG